MNPTTLTLAALFVLICGVPALLLTVGLCVAADDRLTVDEGQAFGGDE